MKTEEKIDILRGKIARLNDHCQTLRIEADAMVKSILFLFEPLDIECGYVDKIDPRRLKVLVNDVCRKKEMLDTCAKEIAMHETELENIDPNYTRNTA